jgi:hypothetical protein
MTRICGRFDWVGSARSGIAPWSTTLALSGQDVADCSPAADPRVHLGVGSPERGEPPAHSLAIDDSAAVLFSGYLREPEPAPSGEAQAVLTRYRAGDWDWLRRANGVFAFGIVDWRDTRCMLATDRLGVRPLFFAHDDAGLTFGEDLATVATHFASRLELDYETLQELMAIGFPLGTRTLLRNIERVPPGTWIDFSVGRRRATRYWSLEVLPGLRHQDVADFLDESQTRLRGVLRHLLSRSSHALCLLSSGYDSRRLLLEGHAVGAHFDAITSIWPYPGLEGATIEPTVTGELCRRLGVPHRLVAVPERNGVMTPRAARALRDAFLDFQVIGRHHIWALPLIAALAPSNTVHNFDGMAGDTFFNNPFYALPRAHWGRWRADPDLLDIMVADPDAWDQRFAGLLSRSLSSRLRDALQILPDGPNRLSFFYLLGRTRGAVALLPYGLLNLRVESFCPYLDNEVMEHALTFDPIVKGEQQLQGVALRRHFPDFGDLPSSHTPPSAVPSRYVRPMELADPDFGGPLTARDIAVLLRSRLQPPGLPRFGFKDLAFAVSDSVGLPWPGGRWRDSRMWDLVHAARLITIYECDGIAAVAQARRKARASMEEYRVLLERSGSHVH